VRIVTGEQVLGPQCLGEAPVAPRPARLRSL